jgi:superfamily I DNA/RNA helicase
VPSSRGASGATTLEISGRLSGEPTRVSVGTMHYDKGLEFKAAVVMGCDEDKLPLRERVETAGDEVELEDVYETERRVLRRLHRVRDWLLVTAALSRVEANRAAEVTRV